MRGRSSEVFHPVLVAIDPAVLISSGVETGILVHAAVEEVLSCHRVTSVNFPLMPFEVSDSTGLGQRYIVTRSIRIPCLMFCRKLS